MLTEIVYRISAAVYSLNLGSIWFNTAIVYSLREQELNHGHSVASRAIFWIFSYWVISCVLPCSDAGFLVSSRKKFGVEGTILLLIRLVRVN